MIKVDLEGKKTKVVLEGRPAEVYVEFTVIAAAMIKSGVFSKEDLEKSINKACEPEIQNPTKMS